MFMTPTPQQAQSEHVGCALVVAAIGLIAVAVGLWLIWRLVS